MRTKFKIKGKSETIVDIELKMNTDASSLTRWEVMRKRRQLENKLHEVLKDFGYDVKEIYLK